jgi:hypothetical protein
MLSLLFEHSQHTEAWNPKQKLKMEPTICAVGQVRQTLKY